MSLQRQKWRTRILQSVFRMVSKFQGLSDKLTPPPFRLMQIGSAFWQSRALYVAAKLDLASILADQRLAPAELASRLGADPDAMYRLLRMLSTMGVFEIGRDGRVANNALSEPLSSDSPVCVRHMVLMHGSPEMSRPWNETLEQGVREGKPPFALCHGQEMFDYMDTHAGFDALFSKAMDEVEALGGDSFASAFDWSAFDRVIDVGGSKGAKSAAVLRRHPALRALVVERPQVVEQARAWWALHGDPISRDRIAFVPGDAVTGPLPAAESARDLYLLSAVLHCFDDATCVEILRQVSRAASSTGAVIVVMELVVPENEVDLPSASFDMQMFMGTRGRERTLPEWRHLFAQAGVVLKEVVVLASFGRMLVVRSDSRVCERG